MTKLLTNEFIDTYPDFPAHMNALGTFVYYRTYSRFIPEIGRRETWKETVRRATEYNVGLAVKHLEKIGYSVDYEKYREEAEEFFDSMFNLRQFLSGRTLWVGGADGGVADKYPLANFNCSFISIRSWDDLGDLFYLLLVGTGVGFKCTKEFAANLAPIRTNVEVIHEPYTQRYPLVKQADTQMFILKEKRKAVIHVGDSKEGWVESLRVFFRLLTEEQYEDIGTIGIYYDYVRPKGARLNTFGGTASGHEPLREMFEGIVKVLRNEIDSSLDPLECVYNTQYSKVRPIHILDIGNLIGNNVVVGGVRRTAEIFLCDADDYESIFAKYGINGIWDEAKHRAVIEKTKAAGLDNVASFLESLPLFDTNARPLHHRRMSNNSIAFTEQPSREMLNLIFTMMQAEGEPGFINLEEARRRRPNAEGLNPCAEILLDSYGVCNLTTVNLVQFVKEINGEYFLQVSELLEAQRRSAHAGLRMTLAELEIPHWSAVQQRDRLLGTSLTGVKDAFAMIDYSEQEEAHLLELLGKVAREEADKYAKELRVNAPLLVTTIKPEGTISQVAGGVSSGLHWSHSPYYIRRIRINAADPLAKAVIDLGWIVNPEVGTPGDSYEERMINARTYVIDFPIASGATKTKDDVYVPEQFDTYFRFQRHYTEHNSSNTIHVRPNEWGEVESIVYDNWNDFVGVSFLSYDGGTYQLAPYEAITKEQYEELSAKMTEFKPEILQQYETGADSDLEGMDGCENGFCPIR
ncbi:ribonucleoside-triphosphate reductase, adenosylcobalamin-dependent [Heyndrickxia sporothermodurans]|uniref:ribonucleoside-triphosphate reductase, adenosylcobalamin-dependent n=1 Tax=Heyndrickxia sporothermodurans TaxID=46224 RepID=UPI002E20AA85|nr:ribonucleoside-triphosphate reductase, adenosylcobalamin-dependent [Heyndrickxia sporothermodurans]MED3649978.1 ribonucleoside-triphosphate reductase, adenosylcobalamin-dependent [Heyndrickxia sporothermodurans]MED3697964.1 ribonucleoside-triphosphate reductase, adenosylcobalamin-dependent [Heyndrickxia sporothermodurans]